MKLHVNGIGAYGPDTKIGPARWPYYDLIVQLEGNLELHCGTRRVSLYAHDAIVIPPGTAFTGLTGAVGGRIWVQHFTAGPADFPRSISRQRGIKVLRAASGGEFAQALLRRLHAVREGTGREPARLRIMLFKVLLLELGQAPQGRRHHRDDLARLQPAIVWAEQHVGHAKSLPLVARQAGLSESHFRSLFRKLRGQPVGAWLRDLRMGEARRLLLSTPMSLKEIGSEIGFGDVVSFNRSFRQFHGLPPGQFRRMNPKPI